MGVVEGLQLKSSNLLTGPLTFLRKRNDKLLFLLFPGLIKYDQCKKEASLNISITPQFVLGQFVLRQFVLEKFVLRQFVLRDSLS